MIFKGTVLITTPQYISQAVTTKLRCQAFLTTLPLPMVVALAGLKLSTME
jgi:hypothetical protein